MQAPGPAHRALSTEAIVDAALSLADAGGLEALSLRKVAATFGVTPMALYRHVGDKDHLLDLMAGRLLEALDVAIEGGSPWRDELRRLGNSFLGLVRAHPAAPFLLSRPFDSPGARRVGAALLGILERAGFAPTDAAQLLPALTGMLLGPAIHRATYAAAAARQASSGTHESAATDTAGEPEWLADDQTGWAAGPDADGLVVDLWVAGVEGLVARQVQSGGRGD